MLKPVITFFLLFIALLQLNAQSLTLTSPNGGEKLYAGKTHTVKWTSVDVSSTLVKLEYSINNGTDWLVLQSGVNNTGSYTWTVPVAPVSSNCLLRVSDFSNALVNDVSNAVFSIQQPFLTITAPNGGETLTGCADYKISWDQGGNDAYVSLYYSVDEGLNWLYITDVYVVGSTTGSYNWTAPSLGSSKMRIKVAGYYDKTVQDISNANFTITKPANNLALTSPNGGESWSSSSRKTISWTSNGTVGNVSLKYSADGGVTWDWVINTSNATSSNIPNTGTLEWLVPPNINSANVLLQIYENSKTCNIDYSDNRFTIDNNPAITVTAPGKNEKVYVGRNYPIRWSASFLPTEYVKIDYSTNNGNTWTTITSSVYNNGNYSWKVPNVISTNCLIKVSAAANPAISGISKAPFTIAAPTITVNTPNGGESLTGCSNYDITWAQEGVDSYVKLYYSLDAGLNWVYIADDYIADNTNTYKWTPPSAASDKLRIKVAAYYDAAVSDSSNANASVSKGASFITLTSLDGGQTCASSSNQTITWTSTGTVGNVSVKYSVDGGINWDWVRDNANNPASNIANTGSFTWLVPANTITSKALIQVYENAKTCVIATSAKNFTINNDAVITITSPSNGGKIYGGRSYNITWSSSGLPDNYVKVEFSSNNGTSWNVVNANTYNGGSIAWTAPRVYTANYLVRVSSITNPAIFGVNQAPFTVAPQVITVKTPNGGESLTACGTYRITWDQEGVQNYVGIYFSTDGGNIWNYIGEDYIADNSNYYDWAVPSIGSATVKIKVAGYYDTSVKDSSDNNFTINQGVNNLVITAPNGGESWSSSSVQKITWTTNGTVGNVSLKYSIDGGLNWDWVRNNANTAASNIANTGSFDWLVPANTITSKALIQVYENSKTCIVDYSNSYFSTNTNPIITITSPGDGGKVYGGRSYNISWSSSGLPDNYVKVEISANNGTSWTVLNANTYNGGNLSWTAPRVYSANYLIRVSSVANPSIFGINKTPFTVAPQTITVKTPNGGESLPACGTHRITWDQEGVLNYVGIYYSTDGGNIWYYISEDYIADNSNYFDWTVPSVVSSNVKIKVAGYYDVSVKDSSDNTLSISQGASSLALTAPNGGESWSSSSVQKIVWTNNGTVGNVSLKYSIDGGTTWSWVANAAGTSASNITNTGSFDWLVPSNTVASKCLIQVYENVKTCVADYSNNYFSLNNNPVITITAPNAGDNYYFGETRNINWSSSNLPGNYLKLKYSPDNEVTWYGINNNYYNGGSYSWKVPATATGKAVLKITSVTDSSISVTSGTFKVLAPLVKVLTPNTGNENWLVGENKNITWSTTGLTSSALIRIDYSINKGQTWTKVKDSLPNNGSYIWTIPNITTSSQSFVKVSSVLYPVSKDSNDLAFTITKPIVGVTVPNNGQIWYIGESKSIQWSGMGTAANIKIEISSDSGKTYSVIIASTANTGQYFWTIPYNVTPSSKSLIKISDVLDPSNKDVSDVTFTILKPSVTLTAPATAESWYLGQTKKISWTNIGISNSKIRIQYSGNKGATWQQVALATNSGSYDWTIPSSIQPSENAYIKISDENDASIKDSNDVAFRMVKPSLNVTSPNGGEILYLGQTKVITWLKDGAFSPNVRIDYSADSGKAWKQIIASVVNNGTFAWTLSTSLPQGNRYLLRIRDAVDSTIADYSNAKFTVSKPSITVSSPNGGETFYPGEAKNITWSSAALASSNQVKIELSTDNGIGWTVITAGTANNGAYAWTPANTAGSQNLIRISDVLDPTISDKSNAVFMIGKPSIVLDLSTTEISEGSSQVISAKVTRTGAITAALTVNIALSQPQRFTVPATVTIPAGQAGVTFTIAAVENTTIDGTITDTLRLSATGFTAIKSAIILADNDKPSLSVSGLAAEATEGQTITFKVNTDLAPAKPLQVLLTSNNPKRFPLPASVTIPAGSLFTTVTVALDQDNLPEVDLSVGIIAGTSGHFSANTSILVKDDDIPGLELIIDTKIVSESGGISAAQATLRRVSGDNTIAFTTTLSADLANTLIIPSAIPLEAGQNERTFNIGVVDNKLVDGERNVKITASVYVNSCGCNAPSTSAGSVSTTLKVTDNDGPALTLTASELTLAEGYANAGLLRVTRNTPSNVELTVNISSSDTNEATVPKAIVIPVGKDFLDVAITTKNDGLTDGNKQVYFYGNANGFASGSVWVMVTDQNIPDLQIPVVNINAAVQAMNVFNYKVSVKNSGFATAPSGVAIKGYLSKDNVIDESDSLISQDILPAIPSGQTFQVVNAIQAPNRAGDFKLLYWVNPESALTEILYNNNKSAVTNLKINPDYTATAVVSNEFFVKGSSIPVTGTATKINGTAAINSKVEVYVLTNGLRRTVIATTDATGKYSTVFTPLANEAGYFTIGASFPGMEATVEQDNFNVLGIRINNGQLAQFKTVLNDTLKGSLTITNLSKKALIDFTIAPVSVPGGAKIQFEKLALLSGEATTELKYKILGSVLSPGNNFEVANLNATAKEGIIQAVEVFYFCQAPQAYIEADVARLDISASSGKGESQVEIRLVNKGRGESGNITVELPQLNWLTSVTPKVISSIANGDTALIVLKFLALPEVPFNYPVKGSIAVVTQNGNALSIPFSFEKVAQTTGIIQVSVTDQFTFFTENAPKVKGAHVKVQNYFTGVTYAEGNTDSSGVFTASGVPEGKHRILVEKDKHQPYSNTITVSPGDTTKSTIFINYQAVTFNWNVVPTAIEDKYDVTLVTKFETHVPMPVVIIDMPKVMPKLSGTEIYAFNVTLTNHGLITAKDVAFTLPIDTEYEFVMNYVPMDLLAQQSIQIPVLMRRRTDGNRVAGNSTSIQSVSDFLGIDGAAAGGAGGDCQGFGGVVYWYKCNFSTGLWERMGVMFTYSGRVCGGNGNGPGYHLSIPGNMWYPTCAVCPSIPLRPGGQNPVYETEKKSCVECILKIIKVLTSCGKSRGIKCMMSITKAIRVCAATSSAAPPLGNHDESDDPIEGGATGGGSLGAAFEEIADNITAVTNAYRAKENWNKEYFSEMTASDAFVFLDSLTRPYVSKMDSIRPAAQSAILNAMKGYEIQASSIRTFFTRWNISVYALSQGVKEPNAVYPGIINWNLVKRYDDSITVSHNYALQKGYTSVDDMHTESFSALDEIIDGQQDAVCASVKVQFSQQLTMTREAFEGTLEISNGHPSEAMKLLSVDLKITDANGVPSNDLFEIQTKSLSNLSDVTGTGTIASKEKGSVKFLFIPEIGAAPKVATEYKFGGSVRYWDPYAQAMVTLPLSNVPLTVNPSPNLMLHYFMERNILGDDALTKPEIEPTVPAELAVMVENHGYGPAVNMVISSAQPKVIENEKGLAIDFKIIGSNFQGQPKALGVTNINFGTIPPLKTVIGQWYFTSTLLGKFVSYEASVVHASSFGNPDLSLVKGVKIHELTKSIRAYGASEDATNDFLVNDIFDVQDRPDIIYFSQGKLTEKVYPATSGSFSAPVSYPGFVNKLTVAASDTGWNYIKLDDPGNKRYELVSVTRADGQVIPTDNAWLTFVTLPVSRPPVYENKFHFVDKFPGMTTATYTVVWKAKDLNVPVVVSIEGAEAVTSTQVKNLKVKFSKNINASTFTTADMTLTFQGGANIMNNTVQITKIDSVTFNVDLSSLTTGNGFYNLTVQAAEIQDIYGIKGLTGKQATWSQFLTVPTVQAFQGIPESRVAAAYDKIQVLFNLPIDLSTVTPDRFTIMKNNVALSGKLAIDSVNKDKKLFYLSGLKNMLTQNGDYTITVDLLKIKTVTQVAGIKEQSVVLTVDNEGPKVIILEKSTVSGLDPQHVASINIQFDEEAKGFNTSHVQLKRNQDIIYLNIAQLSNTDLKNWKVENLGMLTYPEGTYTFTVYSGGFTDAIGNAGTGSKQITWTVNRSPLDIIKNLAVSPDLGFSATDGITPSQSLNVKFNLTADAAELNITQKNDLGGESILFTAKDVKAGALSFPVSLVAGGQTSVKVTATAAAGGIGTAEKNLFIDQIPLEAQWSVKPAAIIVRQKDTVQITFSAKLLNAVKLLKAIQYKKNGTVLSTSGLTYRMVNDTVYEVSGLRQHSLKGDYQLTLSLDSLSKYSSGKTGNGVLALDWKVQPINRAPISKAGADIVINATGDFKLDGSASSDPDADMITYRWVSPAGLVLKDTLTAKPGFTITAAHQGHTYTALLIVSDGTLWSTDAVTIKVNLPGNTICYLDADGDGFGDDNTKTTCSTTSAGYVPYGGDCDDKDITVFPGAVEIFDGKDNDCNGKIDDEEVTGIHDDQFAAQPFNIDVYPVPAEEYFNIYLKGESGTEAVLIKVYNNEGSLVDTIEQAAIGQHFTVGKTYESGLYLIEAIQGKERRIIKVLKL